MLVGARGSSVGPADVLTIFPQYESLATRAWLKLGKQIMPVGPKTRGGTKATYETYVLIDSVWDEIHVFGKS